MHLGNITDIGLVLYPIFHKKYFKWLKMLNQTFHVNYN